MSLSANKAMHRNSLCCQTFLPTYTNIFEIEIKTKGTQSLLTTFTHEFYHSGTYLNTWIAHIPAKRQNNKPYLVQVFVIVPKLTWAYSNHLKADLYIILHCALCQETYSASPTNKSSSHTQHTCRQDGTAHS